MTEDPSLASGVGIGPFADGVRNGVGPEFLVKQRLLKLFRDRNACIAGTKVLGFGNCACVYINVPISAPGDNGLCLTSRTNIPDKEGTSLGKMCANECVGVGVFCGHFSVDRHNFGFCCPGNGIAVGR